MVAKHVELAATSAGTQSEGKGQVEAAAKQEVERLRVKPLDVRRAVNGAEARGPCWDLRSALVGSLRNGQT